MCRCRTFRHPGGRCGGRAGRGGIAITPTVATHSRRGSPGDSRNGVSPVHPAPRGTRGIFVIRPPAPAQTEPARASGRRPRPPRGPTGSRPARRRRPAGPGSARRGSHAPCNAPALQAASAGGGHPKAKQRVDRPRHEGDDARVGGERHHRLKRVGVLGEHEDIHEVAGPAGLHDRAPQQLSDGSRDVAQPLDAGLSCDAAHLHRPKCHARSQPRGQVPQRGGRRKRVRCLRRGRRGGARVRVLAPVFVLGVATASDRPKGSAKMGGHEVRACAAEGAVALSSFRRPGGGSAGSAGRHLSSGGVAGGEVVGDGRKTCRWSGRRPRQPSHEAGGGGREKRAGRGRAPGAPAPLFRTAAAAEAVVAAA